MFLLLYINLKNSFFSIFEKNENKIFIYIEIKIIYKL